jgi:predicted dehydrogenase
MLKVGLYGINGHQIHQALENHPKAQLVAIANFPQDQLPASLANDLNVRIHPDLDALLADPEVELISLCSPMRSEQASHALQALRAGKHVLAEKPCALTEADLDELIETSRNTGCLFHEMAGTAFDQPYHRMGEIARSGQLGEIVQIIVEKSYPYYAGRPQDEAIDGGHIAQNAIHALRMIEHAADCRISAIHARETKLGNPVAGGELRMAATLMAELENGGLASIACNYLNPAGTQIWGNESLKIIGTQGFVESRQGGQTTRLFVGEKDLGAIKIPEQIPTWLDRIIAEITEAIPFPIPLEQELSPTRWVIRAKQSIPFNAQTELKE